MVAQYVGQEKDDSPSEQVPCLAPVPPGLCCVVCNSTMGAVEQCKKGADLHQKGVFLASLVCIKGNAGLHLPPYHPLQPA